jgi:hypothetical protein
VPEEDGGLWSVMEGLLRAHYAVDEGTRVVYDGGEIRAVMSGEGEVLLAVSFGTDRFALWRRRMQLTGEWEEVHARAMAALERCRRVNYDACIGDLPAEEREETCGFLLRVDESDLEAGGCSDIWDGIGPEQGPDCCVCDTLVAATFAGRLDADGNLDIGGLRLLGEGTVLANRCNPGRGIGTFEIADLDADGRFELFFEQGQDEHDFEEYQADPFDVVVLRDDLTVQHRLAYPGISVYAERNDALRGTWYRFEDHSGDGRSDLVVETFEVAFDGCSERRSWFPIILGPGGVHSDNPSYVSVYDYDYEFDECDYEYTEECAAEAAARQAPTDCIGGMVHSHGWHGAPVPDPPTLWDDTPGCERGNLETRVLVYDPAADVWTDPGAH